MEMMREIILIDNLEILKVELMVVLKDIFEADKMALTMDCTIVDY
jgi:hypothetical protein